MIIPLDLITKQQLNFSEIKKGANGQRFGLYKDARLLLMYLYLGGPNDKKLYRIFDLKKGT